MPPAPAVPAFPWPEMLVGLCELTRGSHLGLCRGRRTTGKTQPEPQRELEHHPWAALSQAAARSVASAASKMPNPTRARWFCAFPFDVTGNGTMQPTDGKAGVPQEQPERCVRRAFGCFHLYFIKARECCSLGERHRHHHRPRGNLQTSRPGTTWRGRALPRHYCPSGPRGTAQHMAWTHRGAQFIPLPEPPTRRARGEEQSSLAEASIQPKGL